MMSNNIFPIFIVVLLGTTTVVSPFSNVAFQQQQHQQQQRFHSVGGGGGSSSSLLLLLAKKKSYSNDGGGRPMNEFSRTVPPDMVLKLHEKQHQRHHSTQQQRQYTVDIEATQEECTALAKRFQLNDISKLYSHLSLRPEGSNGGGSTSSSGSGIVVEGTVSASVTQTCVRTNENFNIDLEFPLFSIVRPVEGHGPILGGRIADDSHHNIKLQRDYGNKRNNNNKHKKKGRKKNYDDDYQDGYDDDLNEVNDDNDIDTNEMLKIQNLLEDMEQHDELFDDVLMEDEAIYAYNGMLDVGELVSQTFWLQLDPYPKKDSDSSGELISYSISG